MPRSCGPRACWPSMSERTAKRPAISDLARLARGTVSKILSANRIQPATEHLTSSRAIELLMKLAQGQRHARHPSAWRLIKVEVAEHVATFTYRLVDKKLAQARRREGRYLLRTNLSETDPAHAVALSTCNSSQIEEAFKTIKGDLAIRPICISKSRASKHTSSSRFSSLLLARDADAAARATGPGAQGAYCAGKNSPRCRSSTRHLPTTDGRAR